LNSTQTELKNLVLSLFVNDVGLPQQVDSIVEKVISTEKFAIALLRQFFEACVCLVDRNATGAFTRFQIIFANPDVLNLINSKCHIDADVVSGNSVTAAYSCIPYSELLFLVCRHF
jgi:hypothetical protein